AHAKREPHSVLLCEGGGEGRAFGATLPAGVPSFAGLFHRRAMSLTVVNEELVTLVSGLFVAPVTIRQILR
ncbi:MAG: hypothetical protein ABSG46_05610, partial [Candidatus Binataceae bacterium]